jgi:hypothetical protein
MLLYWSSLRVLGLFEVLCKDQCRDYGDIFAMFVSL